MNASGVFMVVFGCYEGIQEYGGVRYCLIMYEVQILLLPDPKYV
jgi:hypothetical protein